MQTRAFLGRLQSLDRGDVVRGLLMMIVVVFFIAWIQDFKVFDRDFWWHVTAGNLMLQTGHLIQTDPFAFTRAGLPYLATHEWLAQIVMATVMNLGGIDGIIVFRTLMCVLTFGLLLLISPHRIWPLGFIAIWAANIVRGGFLERPQLFTFVIFAAMILLSFLFLDTKDTRKKIWICSAFAVLELLWVNMHGGAALLGIALMGFLFLQRATDAITGAHLQESKKDALLLLGTGCALGIIFILPPNGIDSIQYVWDLLHDKTIAYIAEWQPRAWPLYLQEMSFFWVIALGTIVIGRRHWIFCALLLLATGYLSRQAFRHETLFVMATLGVAFYQLGHASFFDRLWNWLQTRVLWSALLAALCLGILIPAVHSRGTAFMRHDNLFGYGAFDLAKGAADFVQKEKIAGNMFNTYGIGGYLIYRGIPVFIDGRNVDYGFDFMTHTYAAGIDASVWDQLVEKYTLNYAIVDYDVIRLADHIPYSQHLDTNPEWKVVYMDDWTAVYVKNTLENAGIIQRNAYKFLNPTTLQFHSDFATVKPADMPALEAELQRMIAGSPQSIKARLLLANLLARNNQPDKAKKLAEEAMLMRPRSPEPYAVLASLAVAAQNWKKAADLYRTVLHLAGDEYQDINYKFLSMVFAQAGDSRAAARFNRLAGGTGATVPVSARVATQTSHSGGLMVNPGNDSIEFNDKAIALAEAGKYEDAREMFLNALKVNPGFSEAWNNLCALDINLKRYSDALTECQRALDEKTTYADAWYNTALAQMYSGHLKDASKAAAAAKKYGRDTKSLEEAIHLRTHTAQ